METVRYYDYSWKGVQMFRLAIGECQAQLSHSIADEFTVHSFSHPMDMVWATWHAFSEACAAMVLPDHFRNIDQCMRMSDAALRYGCDIDNSVVFNRRLPSPLFWLYVYVYDVPSQDLETAFRYLCDVGYDMEGRDFVGATLFLALARSLSPSVISKLRLLIEKGADLRAVDSGNRGALHFAFEPPHRWGAWDSSCTDYCDHSVHFNSNHEHYAWCHFNTESE